MVVDKKLLKAIEKQKELDKYLEEVDAYFKQIGNESFEEDEERENYWEEREYNGNPLPVITKDAYGNDIEFMGNNEIVPKNCSLPLTQEHIDEFAFCAYHPIYTIKRYFKIVSEDRGIIPFELYDYQKDLVQNFFKYNRNLTLQSRQSGKTTTIASCLLFYCIFNENKTIGIISLKKAGAVEVLDRIKTMYLNLPLWLKPAVKKWNNGSIEFANGCRIIASATTAASIRGKSLACLYIDEICYIGTKLWDSFYKSTFPVISASRSAKIMISTTPNGRDFFYEMWKDAISGITDYHTMKVTWKDVPGRDEKWRQSALADLGGDELAFRQEYEVEFIGASIEYISYNSLDEIEKEIKLNPPCINRDDSKGLEIYKQPEPKHEYCIAVDVSEGKARDHSTAIVIDVSQMPLNVVASMKTNTIDPLDFAPILYELALKYNEAFIMVENNFSDVASDLWYNYEYTNMFTYDLSKGDNRQPKKIEIGLKTTKKTRKIGEIYFKHLVENGKIIINDLRIIKELNNLQWNEAKKRFEPRDESINDDLWSAMKTFSYIAKSQYFENQIAHGETIQSLFKNNKEVEALPFIIKPVTISTTNVTDNRFRRPKVLDDVEKKWTNGSWNNF